MLYMTSEGGVWQAVLLHSSHASTVMKLQVQPHLVFVNANDSAHPGWLPDHPMPTAPAIRMPLQSVDVKLCVLLASYSKYLELCLGFKLVVNALGCLRGSPCCQLNCWCSAGRKLVHLRWNNPRQHFDPTALTWLQVERFELARPRAFGCIAPGRKSLLGGKSYSYSIYRRRYEHNLSALERRSQTDEKLHKRPDITV